MVTLQSHSLMVHWRASVKMMKSGLYLKICSKKLKHSCFNKYNVTQCINFTFGP